MAFIVRFPTSNETPDSGQGGDPVTSISNTGHGDTNTSSDATGTAPFGTDSDDDFKSARWFALQDVGGEKTSVRLKFSWVADGNCNANGGVGEPDPVIDGTASSGSSFQIQYSLNGGSNWITHVTDFAGAFSTSGIPDSDSFNNVNSADIALSNTQIISQIQVRSLYQSGADAEAGNGENATADASVNVIISGIQVEVITVDSRVIFIS